MTGRTLLLTLLLCACSNASAEALQLIISGKAFHQGSGQNLNEKNQGFGLQYEFAERNRWVPLINMAALKDSNFNTSRYIGGGSKRRFHLDRISKRLNLDLGVLALLMTRPEYNNDKPFLGAIPFVSLSNDWGGINLTYVPKLEDEMVAFWYLQFAFKLAEI